MSRPDRLFAPLALLLLASCAAPALQLYTLGGQDQGLPFVTDQKGRLEPVYMSRISVPDYLDSQDVIVRSGQILRRSSRGRLASRLSIAAAELIRARLAVRYPALLITDQAPVGQSAIQLLVNITRLDVRDDGHATLVADWTVIPPDSHRLLGRGRADFSATGSVQTDQDVVALERELLLQLADRIDLSGTPG